MSGLCHSASGCRDQSAALPEQRSPSAPCPGFCQGPGAPRQGKSPCKWKVKLGTRFVVPFLSVAVIYTPFVSLSLTFLFIVIL